MRIGYRPMLVNRNTNTRAVTCLSQRRLPARTQLCCEATAVTPCDRYQSATDLGGRNHISLEWRRAICTRRWSRRDLGPGRQLWIIRSKRVASG
jgi:hypothetical protein